MMKFRLLIIVATLALIRTADAVPPPAANWPQWRGPYNDGSVSFGSYPADLSDPKNLAWKIALPGIGCSTPIVWKGQIIITTPLDGQDAVVSYDWTGKKVWETKIGPERAGRHRNGSGSNPSPITDGSGIYVYYKSGTLAALDMSGRLRWQTNLQKRYGKDTLYWDLGTSPVLTGKDVVAAVMHAGNSYLAAFNKKSGELSWKVARDYQTPVENDHSYATPLLIDHQGREALVVWGGEHLTAHDASSGKIIWSAGGFNPTGKRNWVVVGTPVIVKRTVVVPFGRGARLHGVRLGGKGDVTKSHRIWDREDTGLFVPSPAAHNGKVYLVRDKGEVECIDPETGKTLWANRFPKHRAKYYSSPAVADGKIFAAREDGVVFVGRINGEFKVLSENNLGERIIAAPVPIGSRLLLRGEKHLYCFRGR